MRKLTLLFLSLLITATIFAQTPGAAEKNAGNAALRAKNYAEALKNYEVYLKINEYKDKACIYNTAVAAYRAKNYVVADKYYTMSIKDRYKVASAYFSKAKVLEAQKKTDEMLKTLEEGLVAAKGNSKLESMYGSYYMKEGQTFQKSGNIVKAVENYTKVAALTHKDLKVSAFVSLAGLYFNNGAGILKAANSYANSDKEKFAAEKAKAIVDFKKAKSNVVQAQALDAANETAKTLMSQINTAMK